MQRNTHIPGHAYSILVKKGLANLIFLLQLF